MKKEIIKLIEQYAVTFLIAQGIIAQEHSELVSDLLGGFLADVSNEVIGVLLIIGYYYVSNKIRHTKDENGIVTKRTTITLRPLLELLRKWGYKFVTPKTTPIQEVEVKEVT